MLDKRRKNEILKLVGGFGTLPARERFVPGKIPICYGGRGGIYTNDTKLKRLWYDHKYVFSHFGYNLKITDLQAPVGCAQLDKLPTFVEARKRNWTALREGLDHAAGQFVFPEPTRNSDPSWFGFPLTVREGAGFSRGEIVKHWRGGKSRPAPSLREIFSGTPASTKCAGRVKGIASLEISSTPTES